jgi:hypothetical protein
VLLSDLSNHSAEMAENPDIHQSDHAEKFRLYRVKMVHLTASKWSEGFVHEPVHAGLGYAEGLYVSLPGIEGLSHSESRNYLAWRYNTILIEAARARRMRIYNPSIPGKSLNPWRSRTSSPTRHMAFCRLIRSNCSTWRFYLAPSHQYELSCRWCPYPLFSCRAPNLFGDLVVPDPENH